MDEIDHSRIDLVGASLGRVNQVRRHRKLVGSREMHWSARAEARKRHIKDVARSLFVEHGFHATGVALIAKESGVAVQQLYRDFSSKEEIVAAIVEEDCAELTKLDALDEALASGDRQAIHAWIISVVTPHDMDSDRMFLEIVAEASRNSRISKIFADVKKNLAANLTRAFAGLKGERSDPNQYNLLAEAFVIVALGSVYNRSMHDDHGSAASQFLIATLLEQL